MLRHLPLWRQAVLAAMVFGMLGTLVWLWWPRSPAPVVAAEPTPTPVVTATPEPSPSPEPTEDPLVALRAGPDYEAFAEHDRAATTELGFLTWGGFRHYVENDEGRPVGVAEWTNKAELWDALAPRFRNELLLLGPEDRSPLFGMNSGPPTVNVRWNTSLTEGRGEFVEFGAFYTQADGNPMAWTKGVLIRTLPDGRGEVVAVMHAIEHDPAHFADIEALDTDVAAQGWAWITAQPIPEEPTP
jgi:hypothetical protein